MPERMKVSERLRMEDLRKEGGDVEFGRVAFDRDRCKGCGICSSVCPADSIEVVDKKARMIEVFPMCMSCGDCMAVCPEQAIRLTGYVRFHRFYRYLDRGEALAPRKF